MAQTDILACVGRNANLAERHTSLFFSSEDSTLTATRLVDGKPTSPWMATNTGAAYAQFNLNLPENNNGFFEDWPGAAPTGWNVRATGTATVTKETGTPYTGLNSVKFTRSANTEDCYIWKDFLCKSGLAHYLRFYQRGGDGSAAMVGRCVLQNLTTGKYWDGGVSATDTHWLPGISLASPYTFFTNGSAPYGQILPALPFVIEPYSATLRDYCTIRVAMGLFATGGGAVGSPAYLDAFEIFPAVSLASAHWHNLPAAAVAKVSSSPNAVTWTTRGTLTIAHPSMYASFAQQLVPHWLFDFTPFTGLASAPAFPEKPWIGELVLAQPETLTLHESYGYTTERAMEQLRDERGIYAYAVTDKATRKRSLVFEPRAGAELGDLEQTLYERSLAGALPLIVVPDSQGPDVYYGRIAPGIASTRDSFSLYKGGLTLTEFPPPIIG